MSLLLNWAKTPAAAEITRNENLTWEDPDYNGMGTLTFGVGLAMMVTHSAVVDAEFFGRLMAYSKLEGALFSFPKNYDPDHETLLLALARVGMTANVTPESRTYFIDRMMDEGEHGRGVRKEFAANIQKYAEVFADNEHNPIVLLEAVQQMKTVNEVLALRVEAHKEIA